MSCIIHNSRCICGVLKDKLIILVTHQVHFALQTDNILALKDVSMIILACQNISL